MERPVRTNSTVEVYWGPDSLSNGKTISSMPTVNYSFLINRLRDALAQPLPGLSATNGHGPPAATRHGTHP